MSTRVGEAPSRVSLLAVLNELCLDGKDVLVKALKKSLKQVRLACRALRDTVDGSLEEICLTVTAEDFQRVVSGGQIFPLRRFPRVTRFVVRHGDPFSRPRPTAASRYVDLALPFMGQPVECLQRINELVVRADDVAATLDATAALSCVLDRMIGLHRVRLDVPFPSDSLQHMLLFNALDSLPHLQELCMCNGYAGPRVVQLAGRLKRLILSVGTQRATTTTATVPDLCAIASKMHRLEFLELYVHDLANGGAEALLQLLKRPPPNLHTLQIAYSGICRDARWKLDLKSGRVVDVDHDGEALQLRGAAEFARNVLLPLDVQLDLLSIDTLTLGGDAVPGAVDTHEQDLQLLRMLRQRCRRVHVRQLRLGQGVEAARALDAIRALCVQENLHIWDGESDWFANFELCSCAVALSDAAAGGEQQGLGQPATAEGEGWSMPSARGAALASELLLQELTEGTTEGADAGTEAEGEGEGCSSGGGSGPRLVCLRSPLFTGLAWAPSALRAWMRQLAERAAEQLEGAARTPISSYLPAPMAGGVVIQCWSAEHAAAVVTAARQALTATGAYSEGAVTVHVATSVDIEEMVLPAAQSFWDSGAGGSKAERLQLLLEMGRELADESPVVELEI